MNRIATAILLFAPCGITCGQDAVPLDKVEVPFHKGIAKYEEGDFQTAISELDKALELAPDYKEPYYYKILAQYQMGNYEDALKSCRNGLRAAGIVKEYQATDNSYMGRVAQATGANKMDKQESTDYLNALFYMLEGVIKKALGERSDVGEEIKKVKKFALMDAINRNMDSNPNYYYGYYERALTKYLTSDYKQALDDCDKCIKLRQQYPMAYKLRGDIKFEGGDYKEAAKDYGSAIAKLSNYSTAYRARAWSKYKQGEKFYKEALPDFDRAIKLNKNSYLAFYQRGVCKEKMGKFKEAVADFDTAIKLNGKYAKAYYHRSMAEKELGDEKSAQVDLDKAVELAETEENDDKPSAEAEPTHKK